MSFENLALNHQNLITFGFELGYFFRKKSFVHLQLRAKRKEKVLFFDIFYNNNLGSNHILPIFQIESNFWDTSDEN